MAYAQTVCYIESGVSLCTSNDDQQSGKQGMSNVGSGTMPKMESSVIICNDKESKSLSKFCSKNWFIEKFDGKIHKTYKSESLDGKD